MAKIPIESYREIVRIMGEEKAYAFDRISDDRLLTGLKDALDSSKIQGTKLLSFRNLILASCCLVLVIMAGLLELKSPANRTRDAYTRLFAKALQGTFYYQEAEGSNSSEGDNALENLIKYRLTTTRGYKIQKGYIEFIISRVLNASLKEKKIKITEEKNPGRSSSLFYLFYNILKQKEENHVS